MDANAATYYFSSSFGDDLHTSQEARLQKTPWKTLDKLNSISTIFLPGDSILFKRGDTFFGSIKINKSGSAAAPIFFGSYDYGNKPLITGLVTLNSWTAVKPGVYQSNCPGCALQENLLVVDGAPQQVGRFPDTGYITYPSHTGNSSINSALLTPASNWTNAEVVIRKNRWTIDRNLVQSQTGNNINYKTGSTETPTDGFGFFIQNDPRTLDKKGEWYFDRDTKAIMMFFGSAPPPLYTVETSSINELVVINDREYITFDNLSLRGSNEYGFKISNSQHVFILNCDINLSGADGITAGNSSYLRIENSSINYCLNNAINLDLNSGEAIIRNNTIKNTALIPGMGKSGTGTYEGITAFGENSTIESNTIDSTGYNGIYFKGNGSLAKNNFITNFCLTKDDGAAIYVGDHGTSESKKIIRNVILNGRGNAGGTNDKESLQAEGIYIDDNTANVEILNNSISSCANNGIKIHNARDIIIRGNTCFDNGTQVTMTHDNIAPNSPVRNIRLTHNIIGSKKTSQRSLYYSTIGDDIGQFGFSDSNYYVRPLNDINVFESVSVSNGKEFWHSYNLEQFQVTRGKELHSKYDSFGSLEYTTKDGANPNKFRNSQFSKDIAGTNDILGTAVASWDGTGKIDGGALKISCNDRSSTTNVSNISLPIGALAAGRNYLLRFKVFSLQGGRNLGVYLRQNHGDYKIISSVKYFGISNRAITCEALFFCPTADQSASVGFKFSDEDNTIWLDDVEVFEADVNVSNVEQKLFASYAPL